MNPKRMPAELMNELFCSLPFENSFGLLAKMPNGLLARNVQKMINGIKEAIKNNKLNYADCGPKLAISEDEFIAKHSGPNGWNSVRAILPIPSFNLKGINKPIISFYFEMQILNKSNLWDFGICIGFCEQHFPLEGKCVGWMNNSIRIVDKRGIWIDGKWSAFENAIEYLNKGDYIGIGIIQQPNFSLECFGTFNGKLIGKAKLPQKFSQLELFPSVSLCNDGDSICVHFEKDKWLFKQFNRVLE